MSGDSFENIYSKFVGYVTRFFSSMQYDSEDAAQELWIKLLRYYDPEKEVTRRYLKLIGIGVISNITQKAKRKSSVEEEFRVHVDHGIDEYYEPDINDSSRTYLYSCISRLSDRQRDLLLYHLAEYNYPQIAEELGGIPIGSVCSGISRAKKNLLKIIREDLGDDVTLDDVLSIDTCNRSESSYVR